jgi:16S rRNA processing protein RimM
VQGDAESIDQKERLVPYVPEQFVLSVDLAAGEILVDWDPEF